MKKYQGDLPDNRSYKEKEKDFSSAEVKKSAKLLTYKQAKKNAEKYVVRNQHSKSSCVPSSIANALWKTEKEILAEEPNYKQRENFPNEGCYWIDQLDLAVNFGFAKRKNAKEVKTEKEVNEYVITDEIKKDAQNHKQKSYIFSTSFEDILATINSGIPVVFSIGSNSKEYANSRPQVFGKLTEMTIAHAICGIPNTAYEDKGVRAFFVTDSAHFGKISKREITEEFYNNRVRFSGAYFMDLEYKKPKKWITPKKYKGYQFTRDLNIDMTETDVIALQDVLKENGYFPKNTGSTGYYGGITRQAVKDFQADYPSILQSVGLTSPTGYFGSSTRKQIEKLMK